MVIPSSILRVPVGQTPRGREGGRVGCCCPCCCCVQTQLPSFWTGELLMQSDESLACRRRRRRKSPSRLFSQPALLLLLLLRVFAAVVKTPRSLGRNGGTAAFAPFFLPLRPLRDAQLDPPTPTPPRNAARTETRQREKSGSLSRGKGASIYDIINILGFLGFYPLTPTKSANLGSFFALIPSCLDVTFGIPRNIMLLL